MTPLLKGGLGLLTVGTVAGVGYAGSTYFNNSDKETMQPAKSMSQLIKDKFEYILLESNDDPNWTTNWESYIKNNTERENEKDILKLGGWVKGGTADLKDKLKLKCQTLSASTDQENYQNVAQYCSRPVTIADEAKKEGVVVIKADDNSEDQKAWKTKVENKGKISSHFNNLGIADSDTLSAQNLREKCKEKATMKKQEAQYKETYESYKAVCTNPK